MKTIKQFLTVAALCASAVAMQAQDQVHQLYFLENAPQRHYYNPAYQLYSNTYVTLPVIGYIQAGAENNSLRMMDVIYKKNGTVGNPLTPGFNGRDAFFNCLRPTTKIGEDVRVEWLGFGHRTKNDGYWHVGLSTRVTGNQNIPRDLLQFALYGMEDKNHVIADSKAFNLSKFGVDMSVYSELSVGYSQVLKNDKWNVGGAIKFLVGHDNVSLRAPGLKLNTGIDQWTLSGDVYLNGALPGEVSVDENDNLNYKAAEDKNGNTDYKAYLKPHGFGAAVDLGFTYRPADWVEISGAVTDLGGILWCKDQKRVKVNTDGLTFDGIDAYEVNDESDVKEMLDEEWKKVQDQLKPQVVNGKSYFRMLNTHINAGVDFHTPNNMIGLGLLSTTKFMSGVVAEDVTASVNFRPCNWFNLSASHSLINLRQSCIGAGMAFRFGPINLTLATDYVPFNYVRIDNEKEFSRVPYKQKGVNLAAGLTLVFGNRKDADHDGVKDKFDLCPNTPRKVAVDKNGCPLDEDHDGVPDYLDQCPNTPAEAVGFVDSIGCPLDSDGDGVPDYLDKCPNTPAEAYGKIDSVGCPIDSDGDGVADYLDECPETPVEARGFVDAKGCLLDSDGDGVPDYLDKCPDSPAGDKVDANGCSKDSDGDGVPDYLDKCPNTPAEAKGMVDKDGCLLDSDGDGVPDYLDECPNTPAEAIGKVDKKGCPKDSDGDGVPDYLDQCPNTPAAAYGMVDSVGCPIDTDGDGFPDYKDECPTIHGTNKGCPEITKEVRNLFKKALQGIEFETAKADIKPVSYPILDQVATVFKENPTYVVEIQGHTDNVGKAQTNKVLSQRRADAVRDYLINAGVEASRMTAVGYGMDKPVADNKTAAGRAKNRRVEFVVSFEEVHYETTTFDSEGNVRESKKTDASGNEIVSPEQKEESAE